MAIQNHFFWYINGIILDRVHPGEYTIPETNSSHLKMDGWFRWSFLLKPGLFSGAMWVFGRARMWISSFKWKQKHVEDSRIPSIAPCLPRDIIAIGQIHIGILTIFDWSVLGDGFKKKLRNHDFLGCLNVASWLLDVEFADFFLRCWRFTYTPWN